MQDSKSNLTFHFKPIRQLSKKVVYLSVISMGVLPCMTVFAQENKLNHGSSSVVQSNALGNLQTSTTTTSLIEQSIQKAHSKQLSTHNTWLRLHYYEKGNTQSSYKSKIDNPDFFISDQGKIDPQGELEAFIRKLLTEELNYANGNLNLDRNDSLACVFPARTHWVTSQLGLSINQPNCPKFDAWMKEIDPKRFSMVFAGEYPDRPVSAFGHTLLLIDSTASLRDPTAVDKAYSLNDTVGGDPDDSFVVYATKAVSGGYPNDISIEPYTKTLHEYLQVDNRDVWNYVLDLSEAEVKQIMRHVWETKDLNLPYYFTLDNCASEVLRYIDVVRPQGNLVDQFKLAVVPKDAIKLLDKEGLIVEEHYVPSDKTLQQAKLNNPKLSHLPNSSLNDKQKLDITHLNPVDNNALAAHERQRLSVGIGQQDDNNYLNLGYRFGFNSPLDRPSGYPQNFHLETGAIELTVYDDSDNENKGNHDQLELNELVILRGRSFNPLNTARHGESTLSSWGIDVSAQQIKDGSQMEVQAYDKGNSHLVGNVSYEKGVSFAFGRPDINSGALPPHLCYALGKGVGQIGKSLSKGYRIGLGVNVGCRYQLSDSARIIGEIEAPYWYHGSSSIDQVKRSYWQPNLSLGAQYDLSKNHAIRVKGTVELQDNLDDQQDIQLSYIRHF